MYTFCGGAILHKLKTQSFTAGSSTKAEFITTHIAEKISRYLQMVIKKSGYEQNNPTDIHIDNISALRIINDYTSLTEQTSHMDIQYFVI